MVKYNISEERINNFLKNFKKQEDKNNIKKIIEDALKEFNRRNTLLDTTKIYFHEFGKFIEADIEEINEEDFKEVRNKLFIIYNEIIEVIRKYADLDEKYYSILAVWIIGSYLHSSFNTYPYLFINAMRGSGKTRLLRLIASMSRNGKVLLSPTEAVMFRIPKETTLCIDEFEGIMRKENGGLREMLNACYKKGSTVSRMKQKKTIEGTEQVIEEFEPYKPICLANIWGMEEVLGDRCINIILEKSNKDDIMRLIEDFENEPKIKNIKESLESSLVYMCSYFRCIGGTRKWNEYVINKYNNNTTQTTQTTQTTLTKEDIKLFDSIDFAGIKGRNLELFFPLIWVAFLVNPSVLCVVIEIASSLDKIKKKEEMLESKDVSLIDFISKRANNGDFFTIRELTIQFRNFLGNVEETEDKWINERWVGRALIRLNLIKQKRRIGKGIEVIIDIDKAKTNMELFK